MFFNAFKKLKFSIPRVAIGTTTTTVITTTCFGISLFWKTKEKEKIEMEHKNDHQEKGRPAFIWGDNHFGLSNPSKIDNAFISNPQPFPFLYNLEQISAGTEHAAAIDKQGNLYQWGTAIRRISKKDNENNKKDNEEGNESNETEIEEMGIIEPVHTLSNVKSISCNDRWVFALTMDHKLHVLPAKERKYIPKIQMPNERIVDFQVGSDHIVALSCCGKVLTAPLSQRGNWLGQLGRETPNLPSTPNHFKKQENKNGENGLNSNFPIKESFPSSLPTSTFSSPSSNLLPHPLPLDQINFVRLEGKFENGIKKPLPWNDKKIIEMAVGDDHTILRDQDGIVYGFGSNEQLQLGLGPFDSSKRIIQNPIQITTIKDPVDQIACGGNSSYFLLNNRSLALSCGNGQFGQLGIGRFIHVNGDPTLVKSISSRSFFDESTKSIKMIPIHSISAGKTHAGVIFDTSLFINSSKDNIPSPSSSTSFNNENNQTGYDLYLWGSNINHQLGNGLRSNSPIPITIQSSNEQDDNVVSFNNSDNNGNHDYLFKISNQNQLQIKSEKEENGNFPSLRLYCGPQITALY